ncbi:AAA family ATPase [Actinomycetes bacterium KLBMP 9759]
MMLGRVAERARLDELLAGARAGRGGALLVHGEAGIGKTVLLGHVAAADVRVLRGVGIESEAEVPYAGLHLLLYPHLDLLDVLPAPQAAALRIAFGLVEGPARERFLVGAATLSLLSELARESPLVCLIDDAQWFDQASADALLFAGRRLEAEPIAMVFAARDDTGRFAAHGIDTLPLTRLDQDSCTSLLNQHAGRLAEHLRARILSEARGNPLAIVELTTAVTEQRTDRAWSLPYEPLPVAERVQSTFQAQVNALPEATQRMLLIAAADGTANVELIMEAAGRLGLSAGDLEPAERARLVRVAGDALTFRHPLIRAAVYQGAPRAWTTDVHKALADSTPGGQDDDRRAWHLAAASAAPDEAVARELDRAAHRARQRGGSAAVAAALEGAARLSTDDALRAERLVGAARAAFDAGRLDRAAEFAEQGGRLTGDNRLVAEAVWIRGQVAYERESPATCAALCLQAAAPIVGSHPELAVSILTDAIGCAKDACVHDLVRDGIRRLQAVTLEPGSAQSPVRAGMVGLGELIEGRPTPQAVAATRELVAAARSGRVTGFVERVLAAYLALMIAADDDATRLMEALVAETRQQGSLSWLPYAQEPLAIAQLLRGEFRNAETTIAEAIALATELGQDTQAGIMNAIPAWLAAVAGDAAECRARAGTALRARASHPTNGALASWAVGVLDLAGGRFESAAEHLDGVCGGPAAHDFPIRAVPDHVEAAIRNRQPERAERHVAAFRDWARHTGRPHATALVHRCDALLAPGEEAEEHYAAAVRLHRSDSRLYDLARTSLLYGEWLRRWRRRTDARTRLTEALSAFEQLGATAWAERARTELAALGDRPVARSLDADPVARLTPQERQVARLAAAGLSNGDIAAQLFLSPRTVGHHLYRAYPKLGVTKRMELSRFTF